jgi:hypothetical protein
MSAPVGGDLVDPGSKLPAWAWDRRALAARPSKCQDPIMRRPSVADRLRHAQRERVASLSPGERVRLALELGRRDLELYALHCGIPPLEARRAVERRVQARRRRSGCLEALLA